MPSASSTSGFLAVKWIWTITLIIAPRDDERHVRGARAALIGGDDDAKTAVGRERERALLLDAKLGSENMHGRRSNGWRMVGCRKASLFSRRGHRATAAHIRYRCRCAR